MGPALAGERVAQPAGHEGGHIGVLPHQVGGRLEAVHIGVGNALPLFTGLSLVATLLIIVYFYVERSSLLPVRTENLLAVGRCISVDHRVHHATKEIPACFATGEAAGIASALALSAETSLEKLDVGGLQQALRKAGAWLPD